MLVGGVLAGCGSASDQYFAETRTPGAAAGCDVISDGLRFCAAEGGWSPAEVNSAAGAVNYQRGAGDFLTFRVAEDGARDGIAPEDLIATARADAASRGNRILGEAPGRRGGHSSRTLALVDGGFAVPYVVWATAVVTPDTSYLIYFGSPGETFGRSQQEAYDDLFSLITFP